MSELTDNQLLRYGRHIVLDNIGITGQETLLNSSALIIGLGGLGSPSSLYLAASGVGRLVLVDFDVVELSNLQRQIIHTTADIGKDKVISAKQTLQAINPDIVIEVHTISNNKTLSALIKTADIVLDGTDNFKARFSINQLCLSNKTPLVSASVIGTNGQLAVFKGYEVDKPCYRCLYDDAIEEQTNCSNNGVLSPVAGMLGTMQATQAIKVLLNLGKQLDAQLLLIDALEMTMRTLKLKKDKKCPACQSIYLK